MSLGNVLRKAFMGGYWSVLYRDCNGKSYREVKTNNDMWIADPFVYEYNGVQYLFVEAFLKARNKGVIAYFRFIDGEPVYQGIAIEQPYHMSYPCIFEYHGEYYMIPETSANGTIEMYRAEDFPEKWVLDTTLLRGKKWVDTTVRFHEGEPQLFTYRFENREWLLERFDLDMSQRKLEKVNEVRYTSNVGRPAGFFFGENNKLRPAQIAVACMEKKSLCMRWIHCAPIKSTRAIEFKSAACRPNAAMTGFIQSTQTISTRL